MASSIESKEFLNLFSVVDRGEIAFAGIVMFLGYIVRGIRWRIFFRTGAPSQFNSFRVLMVGFFMNNVLPARLGEIARAQFGSAVTKHGRAHVLGTIAGERLADGLTISALFGILFSVFASAAENANSGEIYFVAYLFLAASITTALILFKLDFVFHCLERLQTKLPGRLSHYSLVRARRFLEGLDALRIPSNLFWVSLLSILVWGIELAVYGIVAHAFNCSLSIGELSLFLAAVNFSSLVPAAPGGIGVIEAFASFALMRIGVQHEVALAMVAVQHVLQIIVVGIPGIIFLITLLRARAAHTEEATFAHDASNA